MTEPLPPFTVRWNAEAQVFEPTGRTRQMAPRMFKPGREYLLAEHYDRNAGAHKAFFAECKATWLSLPEEMLAVFPDVDTLRKHALCRAGFRERTHHVALSSRAEAVRVYRQLAPDYDLSTLRGNVVVLMKAASLKFSRMDGRTFMEAKAAVQEVLAHIERETKEGPAQGRAKSLSRSQT